MARNIAVLYAKFRVETGEKPRWANTYGKGMLLLLRCRQYGQFS
jgi:hypothetical protein